MKLLRLLSGVDLLIKRKSTRDIAGNGFNVCNFPLISCVTVVESTGSVEVKLLKNGSAEMSRSFKFDSVYGPS